MLHLRVLMRKPINSTTFKQYDDDHDLIEAKLVIAKEAKIIAIAKDTSIFFLHYSGIYFFTKSKNIEVSSNVGCDANKRWTNLSVT